MSFVGESLKDNKENYQSAKNVSEIIFRFAPAVDHLSCCKAKLKDGCEITLWDKSIIKMCNDCLYVLFGDLLHIIYNGKNHSNRLYEIDFGNCSFQVSKGGLDILHLRLNRYFCALYKEHIRDDLFSKESIVPPKFLYKARDTVNETEKEYRYTRHFTKGECRKFYNVKHINRDLTKCYPSDFILKLSKREVRFIAINKLITYTTIPGVSCKINEHNRAQEAVFVLTDGRNHGFTFSFCEKHLYQLGQVLLAFYKEPSLNNYSYGDFKIEKGHFNEHCYLTNVKETMMYKVHFNKCVFVIAKRALDSMTFEVLTSKVYGELFPIEAAQFNYYVNETEEKTSEKLKESLANEKKSRREERANLIFQYQQEINDVYAEKRRTTEFYEHKIGEAKETIFNLESNLKDTKEENDKFRYKLNHVEEIISEHHLELKEAYQEKILNCLSKRNVMNIGIARKTELKEPIEEYKITFVHGITCSTFPHYPKNNVIAILETFRKKNNFCFALCPECVDIYLKGLVYIHNHTDYFNDSMNFSITLIRNSNSQHCYGCGKTEGKIYLIKHGCYQYRLCFECCCNLEKTLEKIKQQFSAISRFGGINLLSKIKFLSE